MAESRQTITEEKSVFRRHILCKFKNNKFKIITFIEISNNANYKNDTEKFVLVYKILPGTLFNASSACVPFMRQNTVEIKSWESSINSCPLLLQYFLNECRLFGNLVHQ